MFFTDDPIADYERYCRKEQEWEAQLRELLPRCYECGEPIEDEECYNIDGEPICEECITNHKVKTSYFMG